MTAETTPLTDLLSAISTAVQSGARVPCLGPAREWWTSDETEEIKAACTACVGCPVFAACEGYRDEAVESGAVYAGRKPDPQSRTKKTRG